MNPAEIAALILVVLADESVSFSLSYKHSDSQPFSKWLFNCGGSFHESNNLEDAVIRGSAKAIRQLEKECVRLQELIHARK